MTKMYYTKETRCVTTKVGWLVAKRSLGAEGLLIVPTVIKC